MSGFGLSRERFALLFLVMLVAAAGNTAMQESGTRSGVTSTFESMVDFEEQAEKSNTAQQQPRNIRNDFAT